MPPVSLLFEQARLVNVCIEITIKNLFLKIELEI